MKEGIGQFKGGYMKKIVMVASCLIVMHTYAEMIENNTLNQLEIDAQKAIQGFNNLSQNMSIASVCESIVTHNTQMLENALGDLVNLNKTVNSQVNVALGFWNMYLDTVKVPTMDTYLLGQVINSLVGTIRALSLRSSVDQAMLLSLVKKDFNADEPRTESVDIAIEAKEVTVEDRWKSLRAGQ